MVGEGECGVLEILKNVCLITVPLMYPNYPNLNSVEHSFDIKLGDNRVENV